MALALERHGHGAAVTGKTVSNHLAAGSRAHAMPTRGPGRFDQKVEIQVTLAMISASVGKRPMICLEQAIRSSTLISKTPPPERCRVTCASGRTLLMSFAAARARGS